MKNPINPINQTIQVMGSVFWNDGRRRIDLKRPIRDFFEPLETSNEKMIYIMELCLNKEKICKRVEDLTERNVYPIILYFIKDNEDKQ